MVTATAECEGFVVAKNPKTEEPDLTSPEVPKESGIRLPRAFFLDLYWVARIEKKTMGALLEEKIGKQIKQWRIMLAAEIEDLRKSDINDDKVMTRGQKKMRAE